jgi:hypothetical protein
MTKHILYGTHYMAHWCNLVIQILISLILVKEIESLLASMYTYYIQSLKRPLEHTKLAKDQIKGFEIFEH